MRLPQCISRHDILCSNRDIGSTVSNKLKAGKSGAAKLSSLASMDVELEHTLYCIFKPFEQTFEQYEKFVVEDLRAETTKILEKRNIEANFDSSWGILQHIRNVSTVMASVILAVDESLDSTMDVTQGTILEDFSNAVGHVMKDFLSFQNKVRDKIRNMVRLDDIFERDKIKRNILTLQKTDSGKCWNFAFGC